MGGLVSRWFIEREGGNLATRRLIMLGTPNGGSPWPKVQDWATTALAVGLNELSKVAWPASVLAGLVQAVEAVDVTLDQMVPDSAFLKDLLASPDPKIPYIIIAGNTSLIPATAADEQRRSKLKRLLARLWTDRTKYDLADRVFGGADNDIAVSLDSMEYIAGGRGPAFKVLPWPATMSATSATRRGSRPWPRPCKDVILISNTDGRNYHLGWQIHGGRL